MQRRTLLRSIALGSIGIPLLTTLSKNSFAQSVDKNKIHDDIQAFAELAPNTAVNILHYDGSAQQQYAHQADRQLFVGSAVKIFILAQFLRDVEAGLLSEDSQFAVGPDVWSPGSLVLQHLQGSTTGRSILEAMIQHSDNTATDIAINAVGATKVRQHIQQAGLTQTQIPDSTRKLFSYLAGAPNGTDIGWSGMQDLARDIYPGTARHAINTEQSMLSTAHEMSHWYEQVLSGKFFTQEQTLAEFKRISFNTKMVPIDTLAYGKGGSLDWEDFHCFCLAGQMHHNKARTNFCFIINWEGPLQEVPQVFEKFLAQGAKVLANFT